MNTKGKLKFLDNTDQAPEYVASIGGGDQTEHVGNYSFHTVAIADARELDTPPRVDQQGFQLIDQDRSVANFHDDVQVREAFYPIVRDAMMSKLGCQSVEIFDHTLRTSSLAKQKELGIRESANIVHNDYSSPSGIQRLQDFLSDSGRSREFDSLCERRFAIVNYWRSIAGTVANYPLIFCDARTLSPHDPVPVTRRSRNRTGELQVARYNPLQRWYYFSQMKNSEAMLFKTFDSDESNPSRFCFHSSFDDPLAPADAPPRESIELRCFVFY